MVSITTASWKTYDPGCYSCKYGMVLVIFLLYIAVYIYEVFSHNFESCSFFLFLLYFDVSFFSTLFLEKLCLNTNVSLGKMKKEGKNKLMLVSLKLKNSSLVSFHIICEPLSSHSSKPIFL